MRWLVCAIVLRGVAAAQTPPTQNESEALEKISDGTRLFDDGKLVEARAAFVEARRLAPDKANPWRLLGIVDFRLGQCALAVEELEKFLEMVGPQDRRVTEVVSLRDKCKEDLVPKVGGLVVRSTPSGAAVRLDSERVIGKTPLTIDALNAGPHLVVVELAGYQRGSRATTIATGATTTVELVLEKNSAPPKPVYKRGWFWGALAGAVVVVAGVVTVGTVVGTRGPQFSPTLPDVQLGLTIRH
jgi:hypothetical protein